MKIIEPSFDNMEEYYESKKREKTERKDWNDQLEAIQYTTKVFAVIHKQIGTDIVLARFEPHDREFIVEQVKQAFALRRQLPYKAVADRVFATMIVEVLMRSILHRNIERNTLLEIIGGIHTREQAQLGEGTGEGQRRVMDVIKEKIPLTGGGTQ